tara:strand:+ start:33 stop:548 length:516 start_codon:yes stop_codon:yes gene_type:complete
MEKENKQEIIIKKQEKTEGRPEKKDFGEIIRIMQTDIPGGKQIYPGLTRIKGVSWSLSNATCNQLKIDKKRKISSLTEEEIKKIQEFIKNPQVPKFMLNRRKDLDTGEDMHLAGSDLDLRRDFDIKRLKKIKSYRGLRHALGQPTRGQRTRGHFREKGKAVGVVKKSKPSK